jgi:hypothetical protein
MSIFEPVGAGLIVSLINRFIVNNHSLWSFCYDVSHIYLNNDNDDVSSNSTTTIDSVEVHAHF